MQSQIKSYPDAVRTCQGQNSSLTVPKDTNAFFDFAISEPKNQFWSPIKRLNMTHYQALFQLVKHYFKGLRLPDGRGLYTAPCGIVTNDHREDALHFISKRSSKILIFMRC